MANENDRLSVDDEIKLKKAKLKIRITYMVVAILLLLASVKLVWLMKVGRYDDAKDIFNIITPLASAAFGYWFGRRISGV